MKTLKFTTSESMDMFSMMTEPLVPLVEAKIDIVNDRLTKYDRGYIHGKAEDLAGFDIPLFIEGDMKQLDTPVIEQDIIMVLPDGQYPCQAVAVQSKFTDKPYYLITLKGDNESLYLYTIVN